MTGSTWKPCENCDQAGKAQLVASLGLITAFTDSGLSNGQEYCYTISSSTDCESGFSNVRVPPRLRARPGRPSTRS